jgi:hypothetical protein
MRRAFIPAMILVAAVASSAQAIDIRYDGVQSLGTYKVRIPSNSEKHVYAGRMAYSVVSNGDGRFANGSTFFSFCTDLDQFVKNQAKPYEFFSNGHDTDGDHGIDDMPIVQDENEPGMGIVKAQAVSALFLSRFADATSGDAEKASAFQLALWEIVYEPYASEGVLGAFNLSSGDGTFRVTQGDSGAVSLAQSWLNEVAAMDLGSVSDLLIGFGSPDYQDQLTLIPLPAGALMGLVGLGGAFAARRRMRG